MSDTNPHIPHHLHMSRGERTQGVYRDRRDPDTTGRAASAAAETELSRAPTAPQATQTGYGAPTPTTPRTGQTGCVPQELHVCFNCASELVYPLDWTEEGHHHWRIVLRCPECEARREGVFEQSVVEQLDDELDRASGALLSDLKRLTHANMSDEIEFFVRALHADLIAPSDFHR